MSFGYVNVSGKEVAELVEDIKEAMQGKPIVHVSLACLAVHLIAQKPDITPEEMQSAIKTVTQFVATLLSPTSGTVN